MSGNLKWHSKPGQMQVVHAGLQLNGAAYKASISAWVEDVNRRQAEREAKRAEAKTKMQPAYLDKRCKYTREQIVCAKVWARQGWKTSGYIAQRLGVPAGTVVQWVNEVTNSKVVPTPDEVSLYLSQL